MFHGVSIESFIAGFAYGGTTVIVGQPFETLKTLYTTLILLGKTSQHYYNREGIIHIKWYQRFLSWWDASSYWWWSYALGTIRFLQLGITLHGYQIW